LAEREDFKALGVQAKSIGAQLISSSIFTVGGRGSARNSHIMNMNSWLRGWCHREGYGFYDNGTSFSDYNVLGKNGFHLSRRRKRIFGNRLFNLV